MKSEMTFQQKRFVADSSHRFPNSTLHPTWHEFIEYCAELGHGEIEILKIQDGLPVLAEVVRKKVKFSR